MGNLEENIGAVSCARFYVSRSSWVLSVWGSGCHKFWEWLNWLLERACCVRDLKKNAWRGILAESRYKGCKCDYSGWDMGMYCFGEG